MSTITYHRATEKDLQALIDYRVEFLVDFWGVQQADTISELEDHLKTFFLQSLRDNSYISYIAKYEEQVAGTGGMMIRVQPGNFKNPTGKVGYIMSMYTVPSFRRKGICTAILKKLIEEARKLNIILCELHSTKEGEPVYKKEGFLLHPEPTYRKYLSLTPEEKK